jgi:hypothetical protein
MRNETLRLRREYARNLPFQCREIVWH